MSEINNFYQRAEAPIDLSLSVYNKSYIDKIEKENDELKTKVKILLGKSKKEKIELPERYIINKNATILFWKNKEKTIVKRCADDDFNPRLAFLTAFFQHYCGMSKNKANKYLASLEIEKEESKQKPKHMKEKK